MDGSNPATEWGEVPGRESPLVVDPPNGWIQNTNDWPCSAAGPNSPKREGFSGVRRDGGENARGMHAIRVLRKRRISRSTGFVTRRSTVISRRSTRLLPPLLAAYDSAPATSARGAGRPADRGAPGVGLSLVGEVGADVARGVLGRHARGAGARRAGAAGMTTYDYMATRATPQQRLGALAAAADRLTRDFGTWKTPWGDINRFQRLTGDIVQPFNDAGPSIPVPFTSARWGSLASFGARTYKGRRRCTAPAATASSRWWSSATACGRGR